MPESIWPVLKLIMSSNDMFCNTSFNQFTEHFCLLMVNFCLMFFIDIALLSDCFTLGIFGTYFRILKDLVAFDLMYCLSMFRG